MLGVHICLVMLMTIDAFKVSEICRRHMAIAAIVPSPIMGTGINREVLRIMVPGGAGPVGRGMAGLTIGREIGSDMTWIRGGIIIILMAGNTC